MDLTEHQVRAIEEWAQSARYAQEVRLFGSRAKDCARPVSDVDLAITAGLGHYVALADQWERQLSAALGLKVTIKQYNSDDDTVRRYCDECSIVLFPPSG